LAISISVTKTRLGESSTTIKSDIVTSNFLDAFSHFLQATLHFYGEAGSAESLAIIFAAVI